jgi:hypothetical protein
LIVTDVYIDGLIFDMGEDDKFECCYVTGDNPLGKKIITSSYIYFKKYYETEMTSTDRILELYHSCKRFGLLMRTDGAVFNITSTNMFEMFEYVESGDKHYIFDSEGNTIKVNSIETESIIYDGKVGVMGWRVQS